MHRHAILATTAILLLTACGGGGGGPIVSLPPQPEPPVARPEPPVSPLLPTTERMEHYSPVYHDFRRIVIGVDHGQEFLGRIPTVTQRDGTPIGYARLNDGAGLAEVWRYLSQVVDDPDLRWKTAPVVYAAHGAGPEDYGNLLLSVRLVNAALPEGRKLTLHPDPVFSDPGSGIHVEFDVGLEGQTLGWAQVNWRSTDRIAHSTVEIDPEYATRGVRAGVIILAHELLHALGLIGGKGHVSDDFRSILKPHGDGYVTAQGVPLSVLFPVDREALRALYSGRLDGASPTTFGPWASMSTHIAGVDGRAEFGVRFANGYAEPWARGPIPTTDLADNPALSGSVKWKGSLVGFTPHAAPVAGDAEISVDLDTLTGRAGFGELESWPASAAPGARGSGMQWLDGDLAYTIAVRGNGFIQTGGDAGRLTGAFVGPSHESATGTLERTDLTAAFGASR